MRILYSRWDGTQHLGDLDADDLLQAMSDDLVADGDLRRALQRLFQRGAQMPQGRMPGLQDLLKQLRQRRQQRLDRYDLGSSIDDIKKKVDEILKTEREGIERRRADARERAERGEIPEDARRQLGEMGARDDRSHAGRAAAVVGGRHDGVDPLLGGGEWPVRSPLRRSRRSRQQRSDIPASAGHSRPAA